MNQDEQSLLDPTVEAEIKPKTKPLRLRAHGNSGGGSLAKLSWQPKKASDLWTCDEWSNLCAHLHNGNSSTHFVMGFRDKDGVKKYVRSKKLGVDRAISWAWSSIAGTPKSKLAYVPYSTNERQQSRWGGMDFDAHDSNSDRARELAFAAFRCLLNAPDLCIILETTGSGGWHVWAISPYFHDTGEWIRLLKSVAAQIGVVITSGICEIYPPDSLPSRFGKGMRAPGCWNPSTDRLSEIVWQNVSTSLGSVLSRKSRFHPLHSNGLATHFPDKEKETSFSSFSYRESDFLKYFGITAPRSRNGNLAALVGEVFHQVGTTTARRLAELQFQRKTVTTKASEQEHMESFEKLWAGLAVKWGATYSAAERNATANLETDNEQDAFRIIRSYARKAVADGAEDFPIVRDNLAARLGITGNGAAGIRDKFVRLGIIAKTADYQPNKRASRYRWLLM